MAEDSDTLLHLFPADSVEELSASAVAFVRQYPSQARLAVKVALEAAAAQYSFRDRSESRVPPALRPLLVETHPVTPPIGIIGVDAAAQRLGVSRPTVYKWIKARRLIAWQLTLQATYVPAEQILGPGELVPGIEKVLELIPEPRAAWRFLDEVSQNFASPQRPMDALKAGKLNEVLAAARAYGDAFA